MKSLRSSEWSRSLVWPSPPSAPDQNTLPITAASWSSVLLGGKCVEAGRDQAVHALGQRQVIHRPALEIEPPELLGVERVSARALEQCRLRLGGEDGALQNERQQPGRVVVGERRQGKRERVELAAAPQPARRSNSSAWPCTRGGSDAARPLREMLDEVEQPLVGPVDVLEDEHERMPLGE